MHSDPRPAAPFVGRRVGDRYEIVRPLGRGAFGHTYVARDLERARDVAIKLLHSRTVADLKAYELFEREASVLLALRHRGVPEFYEFFRADWEDGPTAFLVMEYVDGVSVASMIEDITTLAPARVLDLFLELLGILDYLHTRVPPILHRDIKPANVIVRPAGDPVLVDFGAVRTVFKRPDEAGSTVVGTYGYMPYEQYMGQASPASDLFALGATFLHLVTGRPPADFMMDEGRVEVPPTLPGGAALRNVLARMLDPAPAKRLPSARAVREAILAAQAETGFAGAPGTGLAVASASPIVPFAGTPREFTGATRDLYRRVAYGTWKLMWPKAPPDASVSVTAVLLTIFFSVITAGIMPLTFVGISAARKRRLKPFFRNGLPGVARIDDLAQEEFAFGESLTRVRYEFEADGYVHRGSDHVLPPIADRWRPGDRVQILYLPDRGYDSVVVGGH